MTKARARGSRRSSARGPTRADRNIEWIHQYCRIPEGRDVGKPVRLREWQKAEIRKIYDNPHGTRRAILSFGRKNAKTTLAAFLLQLHLCGPEARPNSQLYSAAQSREQAALLFGLAAKSVRLSPDLDAVLTIRDTAKQLYCPELGTLYRALSAEATTAYGLSPVFIVHDELGQVKGPRSELYEALETATGAQENPLSIVISTQAPTDSDLLSILIDDALAGHDKRVTISLYTADENADPFAPETIKAANPAFGDFLNAEEVLDMAESARRMPTREAEYRNLILNQRVEASSPFVTRTLWKACEGEVADLTGREVFLGLDLSATADLTALVMVGHVDGLWHVKPTFWLPGDTLKERSRADRRPYDQWHEEGWLQTTPGASIEYEYVAEYLRGVFDKYDVRAAAFDRWNWKHFMPWLLKAGFSEQETERFEEFGQGYQSMSPALRDLEGVILNETLRHDGNPVLTMCFAQAIVTADPAGNRKLNKFKSSGRIDGAVAAAMALGTAKRFVDEAPKTYQMIFV